ncbi:hypothetical protein MKY19_11490 [Paenibacillus sp. FSL R5-0744]|uniref:hypothetical protein n=1 Tax=unclassified Paenibacillus TaxID=185978 RepID=UPI0011F1AC64|nr:hypothetical protein [Paenibacillus sp. B2(2019)]KAA1191111.1 hypothetical protein PAENI_02470 [Paenibacillus sp. B2(2019)]
MSYFERVNKISNILFCVFGLFFILTIIFFSTSSFSEILRYNFTNDLRGAMITVICFMISLFSLVLGITLKCLVKDSDETIQLIATRIK